MAQNKIDVPAFPFSSVFRQHILDGCLGRLIDQVEEALGYTIPAAIRSDQQRAEDRKRLWALAAAESDRILEESCECSLCAARREEREAARG